MYTLQTQVYRLKIKVAAEKLVTLIQLGEFNMSSAIWIAKTVLK